MASSEMFIFLIIATIFIHSALAAEFVVGDGKGWTLNFDYQAWAQGKEFQVGDTLVFKYAQGAHNVLKVNGTGFEQCTAPNGTHALTTGNDVITLATPGRKWYICGVGKHCETGNMKLVITVQPHHLGSPASSPSPSPTPTSAARGRAASGYCGWIVAMFGILGMLIA